MSLNILVEENRIFRTNLGKLAGIYEDLESKVTDLVIHRFFIRITSKYPQLI